MPDRPLALVVRSSGANCDREMSRAFELAGARVDLAHVDALIADPARVDRADLIGFPGGFSYGDDIASGRALAVRVRTSLYPAIREAAARGVPMIGVCNGFQVLTQVGLLPGPGGGADALEVQWPAEPPAARAALGDNDSARFIDTWVRVEEVEGSRCIWTRDLWAWDADVEEVDDVMRLPIAHGEGRFVCADEGALRALEDRGQVAVRYIDNPNGSAADIAGICDATGRIFGLMPHPERYLDWTRHPYWTRLDPQIRRAMTPGLRMFKNAVEAVGAVSAGG